VKSAKNPPTDYICQITTNKLLKISYKLILIVEILHEI